MKSSISFQFLIFKKIKFFALSFFAAINFLIVLSLGIVSLDANAFGDIREVEQPLKATAVIANITAAQTGLAAKSPASMKLPACLALNTKINHCKLSAQAAKYGCLSVSSPWIAKAIAIAGGLTSVIGQSTSAGDACKKIDSTMKNVQNALTAYNVACGGAMAICNHSCAAVGAAMAACDTAAAAAAATAVAAGDMSAGYDSAALTANLPAVGVAVKEQLTVCGIDYKWNLASAGLTLVTAITAQKSASGCEAATKTENNQNIVDCSDAKNKNNTTCICMRSPGAAGCGNANLFSGTPTVGGSGNSGTGDPSLTVPTGGDGGGDGAANPLAGLGHGSSGGGGSSLAPGSGGGAGGGAGGSGSGTDGKEKTGGAKGLNTNILSGTDSGGGGSRGSSGGGSYQAYLPGGAKDPNRNLASQTPASALAAQVSAAGSKSNWEKVNDRYREAKTSLVPGQ